MKKIFKVWKLVFFLFKLLFTLIMTYPFFLSAEHFIGNVVDASASPPSKSKSSAIMTKCDLKLYQLPNHRKRVLPSWTSNVQISTYLFTLCNWLFNLLWYFFIFHHSRAPWIPGFGRLTTYLLSNSVIENAVVVMDRVYEIGFLRLEINARNWSNASWTRFFFIFWPNFMPFLIMFQSSAAPMRRARST